MKRVPLGRVAGSLALAFLLSACSSWQMVDPNPRTIRDTVVPGDTVRITTEDGVQHEFVVEGYEEGKTIYGEGTRIEFEDIREFRRKSRSDTPQPQESRR